MEVDDGSRIVLVIIRHFKSKHTLYYTHSVILYLFFYRLETLHLIHMGDVFVHRGIPEDRFKKQSDVFVILQIKIVDEF